VDALEPLVGDWEVHLAFPPESDLDEIRGYTTFTWTLGGAFLMMTSSGEDPAVPRVVALIGTKGDGYLQYYFDSRGVVRQYDMTFSGGVWTLERDDADFAQSFRAELDEDGSEMRGTWRRTEKGAWIHDFDITYTRRG
jgi:hypothetical protein